VPKALSPAVLQSVREADHSPQYSVKVKNGGATPPLVFMAWCIIKQRNITLLYCIIMNVDRIIFSSANPDFRSRYQIFKKGKALPVTVR
jgi:hypothetical protein